ncbi:MAG: dTDP-4-dehydrorhamnose reductase [Rhodoplanes sp.]|uniref:dTDP-4-dehydrorhamnose reductase n=1 Tax=Rhodoplanes sp. TaxID=1968906 RepID=UPI00184D78AD|nr:dTDP-4-dehydrorhamnose reductase [Rhodoplanes sp.]NVO15241.1 dTDP-4-dehydrorhamnose reductase [Rhodoplanes sp.]
MNILLFGGEGQLGQEILLQAVPAHRVVAPTQAALDLAVAEAITEAVSNEPWSVIINAAAYTAVDRAEQDRDTAFAINATAPQTIAEAAARRGIPLLHVSTDYVFDGLKGAPYQPDDPVSPLGVYGASKEAGERAVRRANPRHVILRTAWLYSPFGANFVKTMLRLATDRDILKVVDDQRGCPTAAADLAAACLVIAGRLAAPADAPYGTYHFTNAGETTWCGFARAIFETAGPRLPKIPQVFPITTAEYPTPARRPVDSRLDCAETIARFGVVQPEWRTALAATLDRLLQRTES